MSSDSPTVGAHPNYYEVLQVSRSASQEVIQGAYRALAREYHPDRNPDAAAARRMLLLNQAYDVLSDTQRRAEYDLKIARSSRVVVARPVPPPQPPMRGVPPPMRGVPSARGVPPARAPRRLESQRVTPGRPRLVLAVAMILLFLLFVCVVLWAMSGLLDDDVPTAHVQATFATAPLNRILTTAEQPMTRWSTEFEHDATAV